MATPQVLTTWKEIAAYMGKGVRTVQRWEEELGLPVRRPAEDRHIVLAFPAELDVWARRVPAKLTARDATLSGNQNRVDSQPARAENQLKVIRMLRLTLDVVQRTKETRDKTAELVARCKAANAQRLRREKELKRLLESSKAIKLLNPTSGTISANSTE